MTRATGTAMVDMVRDADEPRGRNRFSCSVVTWDLLLELGQVFGWQPQGTTYLPRNFRQETSARHDYEPGDPQDHKRVAADDAIAWAAALTRAKGSPHFAALLADRSGAVELSDPAENSRGRPHVELESVIDEFTEYAFGGGFSFALAQSRA